MGLFVPVEIIMLILVIKAMENNTAQLNFFVSNSLGTHASRGSADTASSFSGGKGKLPTPKLIFIILGVILVMELIMGLRSLTNSSTGSPLPTSRTLPQKGTIILTTDKTQVKLGDTVTIKVEVNSPVGSDGVDVVTKFDSTLLSANDSDIQPGTIFPLYPLAKVDPAGFLRISGIATPGGARFSGKGTFATVNFKALKPGKALISVVFTPGRTTDSNIVSSVDGKQLLEGVGNLEVTVR